MRSDNKSGFKGVSLHTATGKWRATIKFKGQQKSLGLFDSPEKAAEAYEKAATELFGDFARPTTRNPA